MKIGIIDSGRIGGTLGVHLAEAGHKVTGSSIYNKPMAPGEAEAALGND
jgi:predicted dinucleotide-binding enzyme